jgi:uncharacterized SAM-binding protein YcdF (DUF218 family)
VRLGCLGLLAVLLYASRGCYLPAAARFLDVSEPPRRVDYALVLGGGSGTRPFVAAALFKAGLARRILVPRVKPAPEVRDGLAPADHEVMRRVLRARGVPAEAILLLGEECDSTADEARALGAFLAAEPPARVAVVTNGYHTRRARSIFRRALGESAAALVFVAAATDGFDETNWWRFESGVRTYANEYVKLAVQLVR